ncbi:uncharacterized protein E6C27_scaffold128G001000 [Cucumis melo var. makuwa]|uniref:Uncharacterized protein n=1 Tax=Cucumis melo var. makuwa TaxID=1194695 RepID=A0A5A7TIL2_CUCMM|nr:uncharacterized protein E6C27_scaffold128G001000 [Cucumis melo var. makuwa]
MEYERVSGTFRIIGKIAFMGHQHYLPNNHVWRRSKLHDGSVERRPPPVVLNGHDILEQVDFLEFQVMSEHPLLKDKKRKRPLNWMKRSTLLNIEGKTKDTSNAQLDI